MSEEGEVTFSDAKGLWALGGFVERGDFWTQGQDRSTSGRSEAVGQLNAGGRM